MLRETQNRERKIENPRLLRGEMVVVLGYGSLVVAGGEERGRERGFDDGLAKWLGCLRRRGREG